MTGGPVRQFGGAVEAAFLVKAWRLEVVGHCPDGLAATNGGFRDGGLHHPSPNTEAAVDFVDPQLFDLCHPRPTVAGDRTYLRTLCIHDNERQPSAVIPSGRSAVMVVKLILQLIDLGNREIVSRQDLRQRCAHVRPPSRPVTGRQAGTLMRAMNFEKAASCWAMSFRVGSSVSTPCASSTLVLTKVTMISGRLKTRASRKTIVCRR